MIGDPLVNILSGFISLVSGVVEFGDKIGVSTNFSYQSEYRQVERSENTLSNKWMYINCSEYQRYLFEVMQKSGTLLLTR